MGSRAAGGAAAAFALGLLFQPVTTTAAGHETHSTAAISSDGNRTTVASLWIGDSITAGDHGGGGDFSASCLASALLRWTCQLDAQGGTGFVNNGRKNSPSFARLGARLDESRRKFVADVIIVDAGRNDPIGPRTQRASSEYLHALRAAWPEATVILIVPWFPCSDSPSVHADYLSEAAAEIGALIEDPSRRGWTGPTSPLCAHTADGVHPNEDGYRQVAQSLVADFRSMGLDRLR